MNEGPEFRIPDRRDLLGRCRGRPALHEGSDLLHHRLARTAVIRQDDGYVAGAFEDVEVRTDAREAAAVTDDPGLRTHAEPVPILRRVDVGFGRRQHVVRRGADPQQEHVGRFGRCSLKQLMYDELTPTLGSRRTIGAALIFVVAAIVIAWAPSVLSAQVLDNTQTAYRNTVSTWLGPISAIARRLFVVLAAVEVAVSGTLYMLRRDSLDEIASKFLLKFIVLSVVLMLITSAGYWLKPIINGPALAGQIGGGGVSNLGPSGIVDMGLRIAWG